MLTKTIRGEFAFFAIGLALPFVLLIGYGLYDRTHDDIAASEAIARRLAESNADRVSEYVAGLRATLEAVAGRPLVRAMDATRCDPRLADLVDLYPRAGSLIVVGRDGVILCSSRPLPRDRVVRIADEELLSEMLADPRFRVSKPIMSRISAAGHWIVSAVQPVIGEGGALVGTVAMATDLAQWRSISPPESLPAGAIVTVVTSDGTVIARSVDAEKWISRKLWDESLLKQVLKATEGVVRAKGVDGVDRIFGVSTVAGLPWFVLVGLPEERVYAPARERLVQTGALLAVVVVMVFALAWGFVARLSKPIRAIADAVVARVAGRGATMVPVGGPVEVAHVARELNRMTEIQRRQADEDRRMNAELETTNRQLRESEARYHTLFDTMIEGFCIIEVLFDADDRPIDYRFLEINSAFVTQTGLSNAQGKLMRELAPDHEEHWFEIYGKIALTGESKHFVNEAKVLNRWYEVSAYRVGGRDSRKVAILFNDISEFKRAEAKILAFNSELEQRIAERTRELGAANKELEAFSYSVSHDLRAPLRAIDGFSRIVEEDYAGKLDAEGGRLLGVIRDNSRKMAQLIDDLLEYSRLGRKPLLTVETDMKRMVEEVFGELQASGGRPPGLEVGALPPARGDATLLKQVWTNLLANALKFSGKRAQPLIEVSGHGRGVECVYCVKDNGAGFDMRYYDKLFGVFQRLHSEEEFAGTGVGLAIVQRVVARHGGRVWAEGKVDEGAAFYFSLPNGGRDGQI